ncbi:hypothetical protein PI125_g24620 [Phytophthora idaei]|nr:hypothetical protein PI125_g24620 [Phytophthora idaei]
MLGTIPNLALMTGLVALVRRVDRDRATVAFGADRIIDAKAASIDAVMCKEPRTRRTVQWRSMLRNGRGVMRVSVPKDAWMCASSGKGGGSTEAAGEVSSQS